MVEKTLSEQNVQEWQCENENKMKKVYNLCEVCFKPFNLTNIDMHFEAGCAAEIYNRYNITPIKNIKNHKNLKTVPKKSKVTKNPKTISRNQNPTKQKMKRT